MHCKWFCIVWANVVVEALIALLLSNAIYTLAKCMSCRPKRYRSQLKYVMETSLSSNSKMNWLKSAKYMYSDVMRCGVSALHVRAAYDETKKEFHYFIKFVVVLILRERERESFCTICHCHWIETLLFLPS